MANKTYKPKRSIERRYQRFILRNNNVLVAAARLRNVCEKSTADFEFVVETRIVYLNAMIERNSNLPIFIQKSQIHCDERICILIC